MYDRTRYGDIPEHLLDGLERYGKHGIPVGAFLRAILENDLEGAVITATPESMKALLPLIRFVKNQMPFLCSGSPEKVEEWIQKQEVSCESD